MVLELNIILNRRESPNNALRTYKTLFTHSLKHAKS